MGKPVIICVDDEKIIVDSLKAEIKSAFQEQLNVETAESGSEALEIIEEYISDGIDIPIVVSDWLMPEMKGDEFLAKVHSKLPDTMKILLTGQVTTTGLGNAINSAKLYRFIPKPWYPEDLDLTITEAFRSYYNKVQLKHANIRLNDINLLLEEKIKERTIELEESNKKVQILLDQTLSGSINALIKILMKTNPEIFDKAYRIRTIAKRILKNLSIKNIWEIEIASLFSQLGCIDLPDSLITKINNREKLTQQELNAFKLHPQKTYELIAGIPIFGNIANGILNHLKPVNQISEGDSYMISAILRLATDFDDLIQSGKTEAEAIEVIRKSQLNYEVSAFNSLVKDIYNNELLTKFAHNQNILRLTLKELKVGYVFAQDIVDAKNNVLYSANEEITKPVLLELIQISKYKEIKEPIYVYNYILA